VAVFGPRISVAAVGPQAWTQDQARQRWCQRLARDVWQFEQRACSSPVVVFAERVAEADPSHLEDALVAALEREQQLHPRIHLAPAQASHIATSRARWLLNGDTHRARFPASPSWTLLIGEGAECPDPVGGRVLHLMWVDDLAQAVRRFDGTVQTLGLAMGDPSAEDALAHLAATSGVDRVVPLGRMHVFGSPWDGQPLVSPMTRQVMHTRSAAASGSEGT
jgi:hypothetical protein